MNVKENFVSSVLGALLDASDYDNATARLRRRYNAMRDLLQDERAYATAQYNRDYYAGYMDSDEGRNTLRTLADTLGEQNRAARARTVVTGGTPEAAAAAQKSANAAIDSAARSLATGMSATRDKAAQRYESRIEELRTTMLKTTSDYYDELDEQERRRKSLRNELLDIFTI